jgi:hypothetical protein
VFDDPACRRTPHRFSAIAADARIRAATLEDGVSARPTMYADHAFGTSDKSLKHRDLLDRNVTPDGTPAIKFAVIQVPK